MKPDGVERGLAGEIVGRLERKKLRLVAAELRTITKEVAEAHYAEHAERPFFSDLVTFITRSPSLIMVVEGPKDTYAVVRLMMGATNPAEAAPGTIRGDFGIETTENLVHGSDSHESAAREIALFFPGPGGVVGTTSGRAVRARCIPGQTQAWHAGRLVDPAVGPVACGRTVSGAGSLRRPAAFRRESSSYGRKSSFPAWS